MPYNVMSINIDKTNVVHFRKKVETKNKFLYYVQIRKKTQLQLTFKKVTNIWVLF